MSIFRTVAGYTYGHADIVRRAMSKKKADVLEAERDSFLSGAEKNGVLREDAEQLFDDMASFANYAFNKAHAAAYAVISYRTAYLKTHYPCEYMAALMTSVLGNLSKLSEYIAECAKYGIRVLSPDINESRKIFHAHDGNIVFGLLALKNVGEQFVGHILSERENGRFSDFEDFVRRMAPYDLNKRMVEALIKAGAFDGLGVYRSRLLAAYEHLIDVVQEKNRNNLAGQLDMFSVMSGVADTAPAFTYPELPDFALKEKLLLEKESAGMYFSGHMMDNYTEMTAALGVESIASFADANESENKRPVRIAGIVTGLTAKTTRKNERMLFLRVEDRYGDMEVLVFPRQCEQHSHLLRMDAALYIEGNLSVREDEPVKILLSDVRELRENGDTRGMPIEPKKKVPVRSAPPTTQRPSAAISVTASPKTITKLYLRVPDLVGQTYQKAKNLVEIFEGSVRVIFYDTASAVYVPFEHGIDATPFVVGELIGLLGRDNVVPK